MFIYLVHIRKEYANIMYTHKHIYIRNNYYESYYESSSFQHKTLKTEHNISKFTDICVTLLHWSISKNGKILCTADSIMNSLI